MGESSDRESTFFLLVTVKGRETKDKAEIQIRYGNPIMQR